MKSFYLSYYKGNTQIIHIPKCLFYSPNEVVNILRQSSLITYQGF